ncbi:MAG TPA: GntR family transcriptional regulator [Chthoniobacteraceae bacterium]|nr:GntR family transcriptional regulator [Chthoniobacteraceae bacterium]
MPSSKIPRIKNPFSRTPDESKADRIYARMISNIKRGAWRGGERLPTEKDLAANYGAALLTLRKAMKRLREEGWITSRRYHGTVVVDRAKQPRQRVAGLVVPIRSTVFSHPIYSSLVAGAEEIFGEMGYALEIAVSNPDLPLQEEIFLKKIDTEDVSGWLVPARISERAQKMMVSLNRPRVVLHHLNEMLGEHAFQSDQEATGREIFDHLHRQGYRRIAIIAPESAAVWTEKLLRIASRPEAPRFESVFPVLTYDYGVAAGCTGARTALKEKGADALVCMDDELALGTYDAMRELGLSTPEIGVVGAGDFPFAAKLTPPLTSTSFPFFQMGREAARLLVDLIEGKQVEPIARNFGATLKIRASSDRSLVTQDRKIAAP